MRMAKCVASVLLLALFMVACAPASSPAPQQGTAPQASTAAPASPGPTSAPIKAAWEQEWEKTLKAAKDEGVVTIASTAGGTQRAVLQAAFKKTYGMPAEILAGRSSDLSERIIAERRAGIFSHDVVLAVASSVMFPLAQKGHLDTLEPAIILPDAKDPNVWWSGAQSWLDNAHMILATLSEPESSIAYNTDMVQPGEIKGYKDLLNPKWKGQKIAMRDVTASGGGAQKWLAAVILGKILDWDYMRALRAQEPLLVEDSRLHVEGLVHGKYPIALNTSGQTIEPMLQLGVHAKVIVPVEGTYLSSGSSNVGIMKKSPHPNAGKLFVNWLLTKEGQRVLSLAYNAQSRRNDVPTDHLRPQSIRQPGILYSDPETENAVSRYEEVRKQGAQIFEGRGRGG